MFRPLIRVALPLLVLTACKQSDLLSPSAQASFSSGTTCTVLNTDDTGPGSLREKIDDPSCDHINFSYTSGTIQLESSLEIVRDLTIDGPTGGGVVLRGRGEDNVAFRVLDISGDGTEVEIDDLTVEKGYAEGYSWGGGIFAWGGTTVTLRRLVVQENRAYEGGGIAINDDLKEDHTEERNTVLNLHDTRIIGNVAASDPGGMTVRGSFSHVTGYDVTVANNQGLYGNGGIYNEGRLELHRSSIHGNVGSLDGSYGGAIRSFRKLFLYNSTISGNSSSAESALALQGDSAVLVHTTVTANISTGWSPVRNTAIEIGSFSGGLKFVLDNSIIAGNIDQAAGGFDDLIKIGDATIVARNSIIGTESATWPHGILDGVNGNKVGLTGGQVAGLLAPLADNGGKTMTHALFAGSLALDHVPSGVNGCGTLNLTDQRGLPRPSALSVACDAGSVEMQSFTASPAPVVTISPSQVTTINEGATLAVNASFTDEADDAPFTATIRCYSITGFGHLDVAGTVTTGAGGGTVAGSCPYGDTSRTGHFAVTVTVRDKHAAEGSASFDVKVNNVVPSVLIDKSGAISINGVPTLFTKMGSSIGFSGNVIDPGSDDLALLWNWRNGTTTPKSYLVNGPSADPFPSPSVQPRNVVDATSNSWASACIHRVVLTATDDDNGASSDSVAVVVAGTSGRARGVGYWLPLYRPNRNQPFTEATLTCYLSISRHMSTVFDEVVDGTTTNAKAAAVLQVDNKKGDMKQLLDQQLLGAWLNFANGAYGLSDLVDTNRDKVPDTPFGTAVQAAEAVRVNPASSKAALEAQKNILESINLMHGG
jgi:hypothetical protein